MCEQEEMILLYYYEELAPEEKQHVKQHLDSCNSCREFLTSLDSTITSYRSLSKPQLPDHKLEKIYQQALHSPSSGWEIFLRNFFHLCNLKHSIAIAILLIATGIWAYLAPKSNTTNTYSVRENHQYLSSKAKNTIKADFLFKDRDLDKRIKKIQKKIALSKQKRHSSRQNKKHKYNFASRLQKIRQHSHRLKEKMSSPWS